MSLFDKIIGTGEADVEVPIGPFLAALDSWADGYIARAQIISAFALTTADEVQLDWLKGKHAGAVDKIKWRRAVGNWLILGQAYKSWPVGNFDQESNFQALVNGLSV